MELNLNGKVALVTGAGRGIGRVLALGVAGAGADVVLASRTAEQLRAVAGEVEELGRRAYILPCDLSRVAETQRAAADAVRMAGQIDILINCAGAIVRVPTLEVSEPDWEQVFAVNVKGTFFLSQAAVRHMMERGTGTIVNITSVAAEVKTRASSLYAAAKAAVVQMTRAFAVEFAPRVRVNAVGPAYVETDLNRQWLSQPDNAAYVVANTPLGRVGTPADVVGAVVFLASPAAAYITGHHLLVDGGWTAQ